MMRNKITKFGDKILVKDGFSKLLSNMFQSIKKKRDSIVNDFLLKVKTYHSYRIFFILLISFLVFLGSHSSYAQLPGYNFRKLITIDNTKVSGTSNLTDFPVLINITDTDLRTTGNGGRVNDANGYDIAFSAADGTTPLNFELEKHVATTGEYIAWVRIPTLDYDDDTDIYMYYGSCSVNTDQSTTATWNSNYEAVWHMNNDPNGDVANSVLESTSNAFHGTPSGGMTSADLVTGPVGLSLDFDGTDDYIDIPSGSPLLQNLSKYTLSAWVHKDVNGVFAFISVEGNGVATNRSRGNLDSYTGERWRGAGRAPDSGGQIAITSVGSLSSSTWYYLTAVVDVSGDNIILYQDGVAIGTTGTANFPNASTDNTVAGEAALAAEDNGSGQNLNGKMDEVRISSGALSADWIKTEYDNQDDPSSFYSMGEEEVIENTPGGVCSNLVLWLKADNGVEEAVGNPAEDADAVNNWVDQSGARTNDATKSTGTSQPTFRNNATNNVNYNPVVEFDGTNDGLNFGGDYIYSTGVGSENGMTFFAVLKADLTNTSPAKSEQYVFDFGAHTNEGYAGQYSDDRIRLYTSKSPTTDPSDNVFIFRSPQNNDTPTLVRYTWDFVGTHAYIYLNGEATASADRSNSTTRLTAAEILENPTHINGSGPFTIGRQSKNANLANESGRFMQGDIAELVGYKKYITPAEYIKIESYLAIKYGITLESDYQASDASVLWNSTTNAAYHYDITGIGRDDNSGLDQQKSLSVNPDGMVLIDKGAAFGSDLDFILWGNDDAPLNPVQFDLAPYNVRLGRVWKTAVSGTPGSVALQFIYSNTGTTTDYLLVVDDDADFSGGYVTYPTASISGDTLTFTNIPIADSDFFTLAAQQVGPGYVAGNLSLWLQANSGTNTTVDGGSVSSWGDQGVNGNDVSQGTGSDQPTFKNNLTDNINYNPVIDFDGTDDVLSDASGILGSVTYNDLNVYSVVVTDEKKNAYVFYEATTDNRISATIPWGDGVGTFYWDAGDAGSSDNRLFIAWGGELETPYLWSSLFSTTSSQTVAGQMQIIERDGLSIVDDNDGSSFTGNNSQFNLASDLTRYFNGKIAEMTIYAGPIDATEHQRIESYFAIKYGISLDNSGGGTDGDYLASDGTIIWDANIAGGYHNEIIGIGRDDDSELYQKQSHHQHDSLRIYIDALAADNGSNSGTIANDVSFVLIGHNGGKQRAQPVEMPPGIKSRFEREWQVTNTNFDEDFSLEFEWDNTDAGGFDITQIRLLVDTDDDFSDALIYGPPDVTFANGSIIVGGIGTGEIPKNSTRFITIASINRGVPLPIELISFDAKANDQNNVELLWQTAAEINNDFFTIEKSKDAESWKEVSTIDGAGNSSEKLSYKSIDERPYSGISYYRLKQTDFDGKFTYSPIEVVTLDRLEENQINIYPNPGTDLMTIEGNKVELAEFALFNIYGQNVTASLKMINQNSSGITIDISRLSNGIYTLKTKNHIRKIIKQ